MTTMIIKIVIVKDSWICHRFLISRIRLTLSYVTIYFHGKIIVLLIVHKLLLRFDKYFLVASHIFLFILISLFRLFSHMDNSFLRSIFLSFSTHHSLLNLFISFNFTLFFPFFIDTNKF